MFLRWFRQSGTKPDAITLTVPLQNKQSSSVVITIWSAFSIQQAIQWMPRQQ
ncbi:hypothetical protein RBSWK_02606 [Rhodopirellula baltica SWK14]|uniref:Uncharacterized protein n=1 Tax=Rhodopirellula baltica SWK14 TaxID=993516 RepID=L7CK38_RHOBT|nr:hypothetical protein RBSWK_02606 [Rhodopirellula baltica SWK14]